MQSIVEASRKRRSDGIFSIEEQPSCENCIEEERDEDVIANCNVSDDYANERPPTRGSIDSHKP